MYVFVTTTYISHDRSVPQATEQLWNEICVLRVPAPFACPMFAMVTVTGVLVKEHNYTAEVKMVDRRREESLSLCLSLSLSLCVCRASQLP